MSTAADQQPMDCGSYVNLKIEDVECSILKRGNEGELKKEQVGISMYGYSFPYSLITSLAP